MAAERVEVSTLVGLATLLVAMLASTTPIAVDHVVVDQAQEELTTVSPDGNWEWRDGRWLAR